jgi:2-dehydropantoate 2-reductase
LNSLSWPKVAVIGAGAIGGLFGGMLREGGLNVTLIDRWAEHVDAINARGLRLVGHGGDRDIQIVATTDASDVGPVDVVIVQTKAMHTIDAVKAAGALFGPETVAISFQNGLGNEENIGSVIGMDRVLGGLTAQGAMVTGPGVVHNYSDLPSYIGELQGGLSERAERIAQAFTTAGLETHASAELRKVMWKKYLANVALSAASGSTNLNSQQMMAIPELRAVCIGAMEEAALIAAAIGISLSDKEKQEILAPLISPEGTGASKSSLCVDLLNERPTEIDTIAGAVVRLGCEHGIATPINQTLVAVIKGKESHYL